MIADFLTGFRYVFRGFGLMNRPGLRRYVLAPLAINIALFSLGLWYVGSQFDALLNWMLPDWLDWARWLLWPVFAVAALLVVFYTFTLIANFVGAPFNSLLAAKLEEHLTGQAPPEGGSLKTLMLGLGKSVGGEALKLGYLVIWMIPLLLLFLIPGVNLIAPFAWFAFGAWMLAIEYADFPMGNHEMYFKQERALLRGHKPLALGFGTGLMLMTLIPVLNFLAMPVGVTGATALWAERLKGRAGKTDQRPASDPA